MSFGRTIQLAVISGLSLLTVLSIPAAGFGLKTHLWIGKQIVDDVSADCQVELLGKAYPITDELCHSIRDNPGYFYSGSLGPDIYPDLVTGQTTTHPGVTGGWQTDQWLDQVYGAAAPGPDLAFSAGFITHAAEDTFAHTYVNNYAGDIFILGDERRVELRHVILEKYIDGLLPTGTPDGAALEVPSSFLRDRLMYSSSVASEYARAGYAAHLAAMYRIKRAVEDVTEAAEKLEGFAGGLLADVVAESVELTARLATGEAQLQVARETLRIQEQALSASRGALDATKAAADGVQESLRLEENAIAAARAVADAQRAVASTARDGINSASSTLADLQTRIGNLGARLAQTPANLAEDICGWAFLGRDLRPDGSVEVAFSFDLEDLNPLKWVCKTISKVNDAFTNLTNEIANLNAEVARAQEQLTHQVTAEAAALAAEAVALQEIATRETTIAALNASKAAADAAFTGAQKTLELAEDATRQAREAVERLEREAETLRKQLADKASIRKFVEKTVDDANVLSFFFHNWSKGIDRAGTAYIETGLQLSRNMLTGDSQALSLYGQWLSCHGVVFLAVPYQISEGGCDIKTELQKLEEKLSSLLKDVLPEPLADLLEEIEELKAKITAELTKVVEDGALEIIGALTDETTQDLIELLMRPENATEGRLNEAFATNEDAAGKALLLFPRVSDLVAKDISVTNGTLDPQAFKALKHAITFAKLSLLDPAALRSLLRDATGSEQWDSLYPDTPRYSILFGALRSIDGNHQWQAFGLPYPRLGVTAQPEDPALRHYGYGEVDGAGRGLQIFQQPELREAVFLKLFPEPLAGAISALPELNPDNYMFPTCDGNPFPRATNDDGTPASSDKKCAL